MYILAIAVALFGIVIHNKSTNMLFGIISFFMLGYLAVFTNYNYNVDYKVYEAYYDLAGQRVNTTYFEKLYTQLGMIAYDHGLDYQQFRFWIVMVATTILIIAILRFTKNISFVALTYALTSFFINDVQIRNFIMLSVLALAMSMLVHKKMHNVLISMLLVYLAASIHSSAFIYFLVYPMLFIPHKNIIKSTYLIFIASIFFQSMLMIINPQVFLNMVGVILKVVTQRNDLIERLTQQFVTGPVLKYIILTWIMVIVSIVVMMRSKLDMNLRAVNGKINIIYLVVFIGILSVPMLSFATDYSRIARNSSLFIWIYGAIFFENYHKSKDNGLKYIFYWILAVGINAIGQNVVWGNLYIDSIGQLLTTFK